MPAAVGAMVATRFAGSIACHVSPSLFERVYWLVRGRVSSEAVDTGTSVTSTHVLENRPLMGPAPAKIEPASGLLAFQTRDAVYVVFALTETTAWTKAAFGE